jgi:hypothetical protein
MESSNESLGFFCKYLVLSSLKKSNIYKKKFFNLRLKKLSISITELYLDFAKQNPFQEK